VIKKAGMWLGPTTSDQCGQNHTCISHCWVNHLRCSGHKLRLH